MILSLALRFWRPLAAIAAVLALWMAYTWWADVQRGVGAAEERAIWVKKMDAQKDEARKQLDAANTRTATAETSARTARDAQNLKDAQNEKINSELGRKLLIAGRLRDPNSAARCGGSGPATGAADPASPGNSADNTPQDAGLLSADLSGLLRTLTREADAVNLAYIASRADADQLRVLLGACGTPKP